MNAIPADCLVISLVSHHMEHVQCCYCQLVNPELPLHSMFSLSPHTLWQAATAAAAESKEQLSKAARQHILPTDDDDDDEEVIT